MPELPEVRVVCKALKQNVLNKKIAKIDVFEQKMIKDISVDEFKNQVAGQNILDIFNVGKHIIFSLSNDLIIISHLRMEGKYRFYSDPAQPITKHTHVIFNFTDSSQLRFLDTRKFGTFHLRTKQNYLLLNPLNKLAPTPDKVDLEKLFQKSQKSSLAIKTFILNQENIAGIGNIYADETLFASKINPQRQTKDVTKSEMANILDNAYKIMSESEKLGGSTISSYESLNQKQGSYQDFLKVHTRQNEQCFECKSKILKTKVNGRGTYYCPVCQKD